MGAYKALRCDCGYQVRARDQAACVDAVRRHALDAHGIDLPIELALRVVREAGLEESSEPVHRSLKLVTGAWHARGVHDHR